MLAATTVDQTARPRTDPRVGEELRAALAVLLGGVPPKQAARAVERLIASYRGRTPTDAPVLRDRTDVAAYAAYRMPATFQAVSAALGALAERLPDWSPATHLDVGGGTGAAVWATTATWGDTARGGGGTGTRRTTVLDWAEPALALGRELAEGSGSAALRAAEWRRGRIGEGTAELPDTDLVTVSYVLGELTEADRRRVVDAAAASGRAVVVVEPGTPEGYLRVREARDRLTAAGLRVLAPCPHSAVCPITPGSDWCHFAARLSRSSLHRQVKGGSLAHEDEKFAYVAAVRPEMGGTAAGARIVRKPQIRKGQVLLELCTGPDGDAASDGDTGPDGPDDGAGLRRETVTKRHGPAYRAARDAGWGDTWPPPSPAR